MNSPEYPTPWQRKTLWSALTAVAVVTIGTISVGLVWLGSHILAFLQPILIPFAVAGVMAYLLDPVVSKIVSWGTSRHRAVFAVFAVVTITCAGIMVWIVPAISQQTVNLARKIPSYTQRARTQLLDAMKEVQQKYKVNGLPIMASPSTDTTKPAAAPVEQKSELVEQKPETEEGKTTPVEAATTGSAILPPAAGKTAAPTDKDQSFDLKDLLSGDWLQSTLLATSKQSWNLIRESLGGFLGVLGFLLSLIIVPIYLYYFLTEAPNIAAGWSDYIPLRASAFKDEVVSVLSEINGYLIAFFRGQLVVSLINGTITGIGLVIAGLDFGLLIGLVLCFLGLIPYLGITMCWVVSVVIASLQGGSWCVPEHPWWIFPLVISGIFVVVHNIDGLFVTPKIVGESVGLHPLTVIVSVFVWSLLMGGLLGAILAVPMTATLKVLLKRYVWERRFRGADLPAIPIEATTTSPNASTDTPESSVEATPPAAVPGTKTAAAQ